MNNDRKSRLHKAFEYLRRNGLAHTQKDVAERMRASQQSVSSAMKGVEKVLTDNFLRRLNSAYGYMFNEEWLMTGDGEMLREPYSHTNVIHASNSIVTGGGDNSGSVSVGGTASQGAATAIAAMRKPIVPRPITRRQNLDVLEYVQQHAAQVEASHIILDDVPVSLWYRVEDSALSPSFVAGDLVALHSAKTGMVGFVPGRVYAVDTKSLGVVLRFIVPDGSGLIARSANAELFPEFRIAEDDVIRIYTVMGMMRMNC